MEFHVYKTAQEACEAAAMIFAAQILRKSDSVLGLATGSTPIQNIRENYDAQTTEFDTYSQCIAQLESGAVDAVTTDQLILLGYAAQSPDTLKTVGEPFTVENYGIGIPKGDEALRGFLNDVLENGGDTWTGIWENNLGSTGVAGDQPAVDRY